jgi:uncharacterized membrane protein YccC
VVNLLSVPEPAVRVGIKWMLAGTLSLFFALLIRLENPSWAVATAFLCMTPRFVGAIGEKMILRIVGAVAGATLGYLITGSLQQSPVLFLSAMGGLVAGCTMMAGGTFVPYAFYQCAYTATIVAAQGLFDPQFSWRTGLDRCEEIVLGIVVTMVVTGCLWPRYARHEFLQSTRAILRVLGGLFRQRVDRFLHPSADEAPGVFASIGAPLSGLQKMVRLGMMESSAFRELQPEVNRVVGELGILGAAIANVGRHLPAESVFRDGVEENSRRLHLALAGAMEALGAGRDATEFLAEAETHLAAYRARLDRFRAGPAPRTPDLQESLEHAGYATAIAEVFASLQTLAGLVAEISARQHDGLPGLRVEKFSWPPREWVLVGLRGGLAVVIGLFLSDWLHPPGGDMLVVGTFLFAGFVFSDTRPLGDLRVFHDLVRYSLFCLLLFVFLLLATPLMASYAVMNIVFGTLLFFCGYFFEKGIFRTFEIFFLLLVTVILVGVNAQEPVAFQTIAGPVLGLWLSVILSSVLRRMVWPARPQEALRASLVRLFGLLENIAHNPDAPVPDRVRVRVVFASAEALHLVGVLENLTLTPDAAARLRGGLRSLARLGSHLMAATGDPALPANARGEFSRLRGAVFSRIAGEMTAQKTAFARGIPAAAPPPEPFTDGLAEVRTRIKAGMDGFAAVLAIGSLYRLQQAAESADAAVAALAPLPGTEVFGDSVL